MPKGNKQMNDVPKGVQQRDNRPINTDIKPSWEGRRMAELDDMEKLKRQMSKFMNVGKRNIGVDSPDGGAVYSGPKELIKAPKPPKTGSADEKNKVASMSDAAWNKAKKSAKIKEG